MARPSRFSPEVRERAVRMVFEHAQEHASPAACLTPRRGRRSALSGAILLFVGLRTSLRASRYETSERWFRLGLWATAIGIAAQTIGSNGIELSTEEDGEECGAGWSYPPGATPSTELFRSPA